MINSIKYHLTSLLLFILPAIHSSYGQDTSKPKLEFDHILLFVNNDNLKDSLDKIFTPAEKLTTEHKIQGTIGYYYLFYNTYIELLFLTDSTNAQLNKNNFGSDYISRWTKSSNTCPIGFGMLMSPWDTSMEYKYFHKYQSNDSPNDEYFLMSIYNNEPLQPLIYVSMPHRAYKSLESLEEIDQRPEEIKNDLKNYLTHRSGVRNMTKISYAYSKSMKSLENLKLLNENSLIQFKKADSTSLTLVFDNKGKERKEFILNDHMKLIIKY